MDYHIILIEYGKPTHRWIYDNLETAIDQLNTLLLAFNEVNEVSVTIVKACPACHSQSSRQLILNQISE